jgi:AraC-like DNA-binding protein
VRELGSHGITAEHIGLTGQAPARYEDALIVGVLAALLERIGVQGLSVRLGEHDGLRDGQWSLPEQEQRTSLWRFAWDAIGTSVSNDGLEAESGSGASAQAMNLLSADLGRRWTLSELANALQTSPRSLQRSLAERGGFGGLVAAARADAASIMLINQALPLSMVGFACGYADQPHFTRTFKRQTALTPAAYRAAFAKPEGARL